MKKNVGIKDTIVITLAIILCISAFIRENYYINVVSIVSGILALSLVNIFEPLHKGLNEKQKSLILFVSPTINIIIVIFATIYILFLKNPICILIASAACTIDIIFNLFALKRKSISNFFFLFVMLFYFIISIRRII